MDGVNWIDASRDNSPERNQLYRLDNVGLQLGLGLPLRLLGVSLVADSPSSHDSSDPDSEEDNTIRSQLKDGIKQTVDGIPIRKVYITNISIEVQRHEIYDIFGQYGPIMNVFLGVSKSHPQKQFAFITYVNPRDAARVLVERKYLDSRGRPIYAMAADSWHQPKEEPNGKVIWKVDRMAQPKVEEHSEEEGDQVVGKARDQVEFVEANEEGLNALDDDCLLHIFSFLRYKEVAGIERVCKRWQALSFRLWKCLHKLDFSETPHLNMKITTTILEQYLRRCGESLTLLNLGSHKHNFNESTLAIIAKYCSNLEFLRLANNYVGNRSLAHIGRSCPKLKQLVMNECISFNDNDLMSMLPKCRDLNYLDITHSSGISGKFLVSIEGPVKNLRLSNCPTIDATRLVAGLQKITNTLEILTLSACDKLRSNDVEKIVMAVPNLTSLSLCRCFMHCIMHDSSSLSSISQLRKLTSLNLFLNGAVTDSALATIVDGCGNLSSVNLSGSGGSSPGLLSERGISMLAKLRKLTELDISYLEATNTTSLKNIARCARLKKLLCRGCPDLYDEGSVQVVTMCNDLEHFDLSGCNNIGEQTVSAALTSIKMRTNNVPLRLVVGGTNVQSSYIRFETKYTPKDKEVCQLSVDPRDFSEEHLRPDFIDDMFFPQTDSEDEEDLDDLCCDCDFDFDDLYDPTLFPSDFDDDTPKFGALDDASDTNSTHWIDNENENRGNDFENDYESWEE